MKTLIAKTCLALGVAAATTAAAGPASIAANARAPHGVAAITPLRTGDRVTGALPRTQPLAIVIALRLREPDRLDQAIASHRILSAAQFASSHAPTPQQARVVANYLLLMGFHDVVIAPNRLLVSARGDIGTASAAFMTSIAGVRTREGRVAFANTRAAYVPYALQDSIVSVVGLQSVHQLRGYAQQLAAPLESAPATVSGHNPLGFSAIYGGAGVATAAGVTVGIVTVGDLTQTLVDLDTFTASNALPAVVKQIVNTGGTSGDTSNVLEWNLDSQGIVGAAGGRVGRIIFYNEPDYSFSGLVANFNAIVASNAAKIINVSLGACELYAKGSGAAAAIDTILAAATAQGQTFAVATGDRGANECGPLPSLAPSWPASSPYAVAVAGTLLYASATTWTREAVWNNLPSYGATGGSPSTFEPKPIWQGPSVPGTKRGTADVAFAASPFTGARVVFNGAMVQAGGTSLSAPIFAGLWARVLATKGVNVGFAAPILYALPASDFHDVRYGNNSGFAAGPGYDFASGRGSLILNAAMGHIGASVTNAPPIANFSFSTVGLVARFIDGSTDSDGVVASRTWSFGDGAVSMATNPSHTYAKAGTYTVTETVADNGGNPSSKARVISVG